SAASLNCPTNISPRSSGSRVRIHRGRLSPRRKLGKFRPYLHGRARLRYQLHDGRQRLNNQTPSSAMEYSREHHRHASWTTSREVVAESPVVGGRHRRRHHQRDNIRRKKNRRKIRSRAARAESDSSKTDCLICPAK